MQTSTALAPRPSENGVMRSLGSQYTPEQLDLIKTQIAPNHTDAELQHFLAVCQRRRLDPFAGQICSTKRRQRNGPDVMTIMPTIDGYRLIAARTGQIAGTTPPLWCGKDAIWKEVWLEDEPPAACRFGVYTHGSTQPFVAVVTWREFKQTFTRDGREHLSGRWEDMPANQLRIAAERQALRMACPQETFEQDVMLDQDTGEVAPPRPHPRAVVANQAGEQHATYGEANGLPASPPAPKPPASGDPKPAYDRILGLLKKMGLDPGDPLLVRRVISNFAGRLVDDACAELAAPDLVKIGTAIARDEGSCKRIAEHLAAERAEDEPPAGDDDAPEGAEDAEYTPEPPA